MFAFLTDLVQRGIFAKVKAGFLMVGHTHEDIDQLFSMDPRYLITSNLTRHAVQTPNH